MKVEVTTESLIADLPIFITRTSAAAFCVAGCIGLVTGIFNFAFDSHVLNLSRICMCAAMLLVGSHLFTLPTSLAFSITNTLLINQFLLYGCFLTVATIGLCIGVAELHPKIFTKELLTRLAIYTGCLAGALVFHPFTIKKKQD